jgi:hypothetical protein
MRDDHHIVAGDDDIELEEVDALLDRIPERGKSVFGP